MPALLIGSLAVLALVIGIWAWSLVRRDAGVIDIFWGPGFVLLAWIYALTGSGAEPRRTLVVVLVSLWGLRLAAYIAWRSRGKDEDYRYRAMRERWGSRFPIVSLFTVFLLQGALMWLLGMPLYRAITAQSPGGLSWIDGLATTLALAGLVIEAVADWQLARFKAIPGNRGRLMTVGLRRFSRHPNYFGDAVVWWGFGLFALATPGGSWTLYAPVLMTFLLMRVSGVPLLEKRMSETKPGYREYVERTHAFVPWFPRRSRPDPAAADDQSRR